MFHNGGIHKEAVASFYVEIKKIVGEKSKCSYLNSRLQSENLVEIANPMICLKATEPTLGY